MLSYKIPYHQTDCDADKALAYSREVIESGQTSGNKRQSELVQNLLKREFAFKEVFLMPSATSALESMALLLDIQPGDEVIMPSFTFVSTANAFALRGARIVFVDIEPETLNLCPRALERAITPKTKACVVIHYAGVAAKIQEIQVICEQHQLHLLEDTAQCLGAQFEDKFLGHFGTMACLSFHESKMVQCGEGGALIINDPSYVDRAHILQDKGTNRYDFSRGLVRKYHWLDLGSSYLMPELSAAYLRSQLENWRTWLEIRQQIWQQYFLHLQSYQDRGWCQLAKVPQGAKLNGHIFYVIFPERVHRDKFIEHMKNASIEVSTHYEPLHQGQAARQFAEVRGSMPVTEQVAAGLVRLPIYPKMYDQQAKVIEAIQQFFKIYFKTFNETY